MNPVAIIPARSGSKGIPGKNLMNFCGRPLLAWSIKQAKDVGLPVYVTTEDKDIKACALEHHVNVIDRPIELAQDDSLMQDVIRHAVRFLYMDREKSYDTVILFQPTNPLRPHDKVKEFINRYVEKKACVSYCCYEDTKIEIPNDFTDIHMNRQQLSLKTFLHGMLFIFHSNCTPIGGLECGGQCLLHITPRWCSFELDEPEDIEICEFYMRKKILCCGTEG